MKAALIVMTILGCDHDVNQCQYISTVDGTWPSIAQCDTDSQKQLPRFSNANYPVVVAVCESSGPGLAATDPQPQVTAPLEQAEAPAPHAAEAQPGLPKRALEFLSGAVPDREKLKTLVSKPVHYIEDGYSWVARRFAN